MIYLGLRTFIGVCTVIFLQFIQKRRISELFILPLRAILIGIPGITIYTIFLALAFSLAPEEEVGTINLINYLWPLWMVILEVILLGKKPNKILYFSGILLGFTGLALSSNINFHQWTHNSFLPYALALSGGFFWAAYSVLIKKWGINESQSGTAFHFTICSLTAFLFALLKGEYNCDINWSASAIFWILFGGIGPIGIAYYCWEIGIKKGSVTFIASLSYFIPIGSSVLIGIVFKDAMNPGLIPGALLISFGALLIKRAVNGNVLNQRIHIK
jgi:drug/metabolite transporter (DMT)-like permease